MLRELEQAKAQYRLLLGSSKTQGHLPQVL